MTRQCAGAGGSTPPTPATPGKKKSERRSGEPKKLEITWPAVISLETHFITAVRQPLARQPLRLGNQVGTYFQHSIKIVYPFAVAAISAVGIGLFDRAVSYGTL